MRRKEPSHVLAAPLDAAVAFVVHQFAANFVGYLSVIRLTSPVCSWPISPVARDATCYFRLMFEI